MKSYHLYVGTYGQHIHVLSYDEKTGEIAPDSKIEAMDASYIALNGSSLHAVSERGGDSGVHTFYMTKEGWIPGAMFHEVGADPCFILSIDGKQVVTADYSGGSFSLFDIADGFISKRAQCEHFQTIYDGNPPVPGRQDTAHIHQVREIPASICGDAGRFFLASDLGNDLIRVLRYSASRLEQVSVIECGTGSGPRHMEFNEDASMLYCITELSGELIGWRISTESGIPQFMEVQRLVADQCDAHGSADIHLHPNGRWLYTSHRLQGDGSSVFNVMADGLVEKVGYRLTGKHPRNFTFSPDGRKMLVACRDTQSIEVYDLDAENGMLSEGFSSFILDEDRPVCLVFEQND